MSDGFGCLADFLKKSENQPSNIDHHLPAAPAARTIISFSRSLRARGRVDRSMGLDYHAHKRTTDSRLQGLREGNAP
jgi:hypothetical protein